MNIDAAITAFARKVNALASRIGDLEREAGRPSTGAWLTPTLINSWVNYGGSERTARYRIEGDRVWVEGTVKSGTTGTVVFNLPAGYRPPMNLQFVQISGGFAVGDAVVASNGDVTLYSANTTIVAMNFSFSITT